MSDDEDEVGEEVRGEGAELAGEGGHTGLVDHQFPIEEIILEKALTFEEASKCLHTLAKDESGIRYAYIMMSPVDRKLTDVKIVVNFKHVMFLDLSGNYLNTEAVQCLTEMAYLVYLRLDRNRLETMDFDQMKYLQILGLNRNLIMQTEDIKQPALEVLELEYNMIQFAQFEQDNVKNVKQLDMKGNYLTDLSGSYPPKLENLYLAENRISRLDPSCTSKFKNLKILHLRSNNIRKLDGFANEMVSLHYLNLRQNRIGKLREFRKLQCLPSLATLIITGNPIAGDPKPVMETEGEGDEEDEEQEGEAMDDMARIGVLMFLPNLKRLNKLPVTVSEREHSVTYREERLEEVMAEESDEDVSANVPNAVDDDDPTMTTVTSTVDEEDTTEAEDVSGF